MKKPQVINVRALKVEFSLLHEIVHFIIEFLGSPGSFCCTHESFHSFEDFGKSCKMNSKSAFLILITKCFVSRLQSLLLDITFKLEDFDLIHYSLEHERMAPGNDFLAEHFSGLGICHVTLKNASDQGIHTVILFGHHYTLSLFQDV